MIYRFNAIPVIIPANCLWMLTDPKFVWKRLRTVHIILKKIKAGGLTT